MSDFKQITITTKETKHCIVCDTALKTGTKALAKFTKNFGHTCSIFICSGDCLADYQEFRKKGTAESMLNRLAVQFN